MKTEKATVSSYHLICTDGHSFWALTDSPLEYMLHPVYVRFVIISILLYGLMDHGTAGTLLTGWQKTGLWSLLLVNHFAWLILCLLVSRVSIRRGWTSALYTPIVLIPQAIIGRLILQWVIVISDGGTPPTINHLLSDMLRDIFVLLLFDLIHAHFVVAAHPLASRVDPNRPQPIATIPYTALHEVPVPEVMAEPDPPVPVPAAPPSEAARPMITIGKESVAVQDILSLQSEDHYLRVITPSANMMIRAKMSDVVAQLPVGLGMQIHRSHWVAFASIRAIKEGEEGQATVDVTTGDSFKVSRSRKHALSQAVSLVQGIAKA